MASPRFFQLEPAFVVADSGRVTFMNPYSWLVSRDRGHADLGAFRIYADGILLVWLYNRLYGKKIGRFAFDYSSVAGPVFSEALAKNRSVYLIGGAEGVAAEAAKVIRMRHSGIRIVGTRSGFFADTHEHELALAAASIADVVVAGMGVPAQEAFVAELWRRGWRGAGYTCGGFMDQIIGTDGGYFPGWSNRFHLRWLYRLYREPGRLWKRYFIDYPIFLGIFTADWLRHRARRS